MGDRIDGCRRGAAVAVVGLCGLWLALAQAAPPRFDRGRALYEHHCQFCHESWAHSREGRHVATIDGLRKRVRAWSIHSGLDWGPSEIDDVTAYLNRRFYHLER
jgi:mono/diheme cytochrome c family protein